MDDLNPPAAEDRLPYWMKGETRQNYGDFLGELLVERLFDVAYPGHLRVIGSCLADDDVPDAGTPIVFWGCGARDERGMSEAALARVEIPSVRGPLTRSVLRLGHAVPIGDPALLLPALHTPASAPRAQGAALLVPHFHDGRSDDALLSLSGAEAVLRPNLPNRREALLDLVDAIAGARFVLAASLHAAITACAYGVPFAFWDSGVVDLPFEWRDFAASIGIPCAFHARIADAEAWFARDAAAAIRIPAMWPMLAAAPLPVRPAILLAVIRDDVERHGTAALTAAAVPRGASALLGAIADELHESRRLLGGIADAVDTSFPIDAAAADGLVERLLRAGTERGEMGAALAELRRTQAAAEQRVADEAASRRAAEAAAEAAREAVARRLRGGDLPPLTAYEFRKVGAFMRERDDERERLALQVRALTLQLESAAARDRLPESTTPLVRALESSLATLRAEHELVLRSTVWRVGSRLVARARRHPALRRRSRRVIKLGWWLVSGRLGTRLRARREMREAIERLHSSRLFDAGYYLTRHADIVPPGSDALMHYLWMGAPSGLDPHPLFDTSWYASQMPPGSTMNPLAHYLSGTGTIDPHPLFDQACYLAQTGVALAPGGTALEHYLASDDAAVRAPNAVFDPRAYLVEYPDAAGHPGGPLQHYVETGEARGLAPHPLFDPMFYASRHPECAELGPFGHYLRVGHAAGHAGSATMLELRIPTLPHRLAGTSIEHPDVSIIVPTYGHLFETIRCLAAVLAHTGAVAYEVIVADDRPHAPIAPVLAADGLVVQLNDSNLGFLRSCNAAAKRARGRLLVFLNNDTIVGPDWLAPMVATVDADPRVGMVGCKLLNPDGTIQEAGGIIHSNGWGLQYGSGDDPRRGAYNFARQVDVVTGACFLVRRDLFERLGGFDDRYAPAFYEEFDLATALRDAGYHVVYQPASVVVHHGSASYGTEIRDRQSKRNHAKFCAKWRTLLARQPVEGNPIFLVRARPSPRGVILVIDDKVPEYDKHAGAVTLFQYLNLMVELGLKVIFHPQDAQPLQPYTDALQRRGIEIVYAPDTLSDWLEKNGRHVDFIWTARPYVTFPILDLIKRTTGAPILYYTHDLHYLREKRRFELDGNAWAREESARLKPMELGIFANVDWVMTPSSEEAKIIASEVPDARVVVVPPYLFDEASIDPARLDFAGRRDVLFVGGFDHTPNVDAALWLVRDIMPLVWARAPDTCAMIVGNAPPAEVRALAGDRVLVTGFVPEIDPYFARARASVSPLRYGAGVKGKIVSALQAGVPVVTTGCGNEGIQLLDGVEALIGETAQEIADAIIRLLDDASLCREMAQAGTAVVRDRFSATRARRILRGLLGDDLCPVCGTRPRHPQPAAGARWGEAIACMTCMARNRSAELARVMLAPFHRRRVVSIREARPRLDDSRIHAFGRPGALARELAALPHFTCSDDTVGVADGSVDLLVTEDLFEPARFRSETYRVLRAGGRLVYATSDMADAHLAELRAAGFSVTLHPAGPEDDGVAPLAVVEASRRD